MKQTTSQNRTKKITQTALFTAIICVMTMVPKIPAPPNGYVHPGDAFVMLSGLFLGPMSGALASGIGSCLADFFGGYALYTPATFLIKASMSLATWFSYQKLFLPHLPKQTAKTEAMFCLFSALISSVLNVCGYLGFEWILYGTAAMAGIPGNAMQGIFGAILSSLLYPMMKKIFLLSLSA